MAAMSSSVTQTSTAGIFQYRLLICQQKYSLSSFIALLRTTYMRVKKISKA